jgi:hypothetical protein
MTLPRLIPSTPAWRLTLSFDVRSIIFLRLAPDPPCRARRAKNWSQRQLPDLRMQSLHVNDRLRLGFRRRAKNHGGAFQELIAPLLDPDRMDIKVLRQLDQGLLALDRCNGHLRLEGRTRDFGAVVLPWSSPRSRQSCRRCAENPLILGVQFSRAWDAAPGSRRPARRAPPSAPPCALPCPPSPASSTTCRGRP